MSETTWYGAPAVLTASDSPAMPWIVTLPEGHAEYGYAPGSQFLSDYAGLQDAAETGGIDRQAEADYRAHSSSITGIVEGP